MIATLEGEIKDTPWWRFIRLIELKRKLEEARSFAFSHGMQMALNDLEEMGILKRN